MARFPEVGESFGPYWIVGTLGRGGAGIVFEAQDTRLGRKVALKVLSPLLAEDPDFAERFERETAQLVRLSSLHVVQTYEGGEHDGCFYLATQLVPGGDLGALVGDQGPLPPKVTVSVLGQLCEALSEAHQAGVVHGGIKPSNVLVRDRGTVLYAYLCDFGVAGTDESVQNRSGRVPGSTAYLAPELHEGVRADVRSDVYSLGCVLWTALTGAAPYQGTDVQVALAHLRDPVPQLATSADGSLQVNGVLRRALAKDPADRYQTAAELGAALTGLTSLPGPVRMAPSAPVVAPDVDPVGTVAAQPPQEPPVETTAPEDETPRRRLFSSGLPNAFTAPPARDVEPRDVEAEPPAVPRPLFVDETPAAELATAPEPVIADPRRGRRARRKAGRHDGRGGSSEAKPSRRERRAARKAARRAPEEDDPGGALQLRARPPLPRAAPTRAEKLGKKRDLGWLVPGALLGVVPVVALVGVFILVNRGTPAQSTAAIVVDTGSAFSVGAFDVKAGWTVNPAPDVSTDGEPVTRIVIGDLSVTNASQDAQTASMMFSFVKAGKVITTVECRSGVVGAGLEQAASCTTEVAVKSYDGWDKITVDEDPDA